MVFWMVLGQLAQVIPAGYIVITGEVPAWARITLGVWLCLWTLILISEYCARLARR